MTNALPLLIGYARVSTDDQNLDQRRASLQAVGCKRVYEEKISGAKRDKAQLALMFDHLRPDDVVTVARLDRFARSTRDVLDIAEKIEATGAHLRSLAEPWADTTSPVGRMVLTVFAGTAEFERSLIHERTSTGRAAAKVKGVRFGRPRGLPRISSPWDYGCGRNGVGRARSQPSGTWMSRHCTGAWRRDVTRILSEMP